MGVPAERTATDNAGSSQCLQEKKQQRASAEGKVSRKRPRENPTQPSETGAAEHDEGAEADECIEEAGKQDEAAEEPSGCARRVRARTSGFNVGTEGEELVAFAWLEEHSAEPRAKVLLEQIREWRGASTNVAKRALLKKACDIHHPSAKRS